MRDLIHIVESQQLNEASLDKEIDAIVSALPDAKNGMVDRDAVLKKGYDKALALNDEFNALKRFAISDDFIERQYFGKVAEKYGLKGMYQKTGGFVMIKKDEFGRYQSAGSGSKGSAARQNDMGLLPERIAKKMDIEIKLQSDQEAGKDAEKELDSDKSDKPIIGTTKKGKKYYKITDDNAVKYIKRYRELAEKMAKPAGDPEIYSSKFKSVFGNLYNQLNEQELSASENEEMEMIIRGFGVAIRNNKLYTNSIKRDIIKILNRHANMKSNLAKITGPELDLPGDGMTDTEREAGAGKDSDSASDQEAGKDADSKGRIIDGALAKFAESGKGGLANDPDEVEAIKELQDRLKEMGIGMTIDGKYSKGTVDAVKRLQEMLGEKQDGDAGPKTIKSLLKFNRNPGLITFYDDLKRLAELSKKIQKESNDFRYVLTILEGGNLLEALTADEQKEYDELMKKHQAKFDDGEYQINLPKSVKDLMSQVIKGGGLQSDQGAGKDAETDNAEKGKDDSTTEKPKIIGGWFIPFPKSLQKDIIGGTRDYFINLYTTDRGEIYISRSDKKNKAKRIYTKQDDQNKRIREYLDQVGIELIIGDPYKGPSGDAETKIASDQEAGKDAEKEPTYDTVYTGAVDKDIDEFFKGVVKGLDPDDEMDDFLDSVEKTVEASAGDVAKLQQIDSSIGRMISIMNGNQRLPSNSDPETRIIRNLDVDSNKLGRAIASLKEFRKTDVLVAMQAKPKDNEKDVAANQDATKDAETDGKSQEKDAAPLAIGAGNKEIAMALYKAAKGFGTDVPAIESALKKIKDSEQYKAVDKEFKGLNLYDSIQTMITKETSFGTEKRLLALIKSIQAKAPAKAQDNEPNKDSEGGGKTVAPKDLGDGKMSMMMPKDGSWDSVVKTLGFPNLARFANVTRTLGVSDSTGKKLDANDVLKNPMKYAGKVLIWAKNPIKSGVTSNSDQASSDKSTPSTTAQTNADSGPETVMTSKEYDMTKKINEAASMNISMSGDNAQEVTELVSILRNAGMHDAGPVSSDMMPPMAKTISMVDEPPMMDMPKDSSPCGMGEEGVEEDWDNSPDEEYKDDDYMNKDIAGGLNRPKPPGALRAKDPAIHNEDVDKYKSELRKGLQDLYKTI